MVNQYSRFTALDSWSWDCQDSSTGARLWIAFDENPRPPRLLRKGGGGGTRSWIAFDAKSNESSKSDLQNINTDNITDEQTDSGINSDTYVVDVPIYAEEEAVVGNGSFLGVEPSGARCQTPLLKGSTSARIISTLKSIMCMSYG